MENDWEKEGVNYWENEDCPREYLEKALVDLVEYVEGTVVPIEETKKMSEDKLREDVGFYEYVADK
ncbi:hypothetical protein [Staphylococcus phage vB_SsapH-Golestan-105-M]|nr:hypothetical protein [Staphylococcus phage vB_SsapH-Golestan-105-M]